MISEKKLTLSDHVSPRQSRRPTKQKLIASWDHVERPAIRRSSPFIAKAGEKPREGYKKRVLQSKKPTIIRVELSQFLSGRRHTESGINGETCS